VNYADFTKKLILPPDFEAPSDLDLNNTYIVKILADDGQGGETVQTFTITVNDVPGA